MHKQHDYEYQRISRRAHRKCEKIANHILEKTLRIYHPNDYWNLNHSNVINYLIHVIGKPKIVLFCGAEDTHTLHVKITDFNYTVSEKNINLRAVKINKVKQVFCDRVSGFTVFSSKGPIIFINVEYNVWPKILFTIYHELIHCYLAKTNAGYLDSAIR